MADFFRASLSVVRVGGADAPRVWVMLAPLTTQATLGKEMRDDHQHRNEQSARHVGDAL